MDFHTITLMLLAGLLHAGWHSLVKSGADQLTVLAGMGLVASIAAGAAIPFLPAPPVAIWPVMVASIGLHVAYRLALTSAYSRGDLGQAFPLARGAVPLLAAFLAFLVLGQVPTTGQYIGIGFISAGLLILALERLGDGINWPLLAAAAAAGLTVACYSVLDAYGTRLSASWAGFTAWLIVLDNGAFLCLSRLLRGKSLWIGFAAMRYRILASGLLGVVSFSVFLWALSRSPVGAVSALRETSVLFALLIGVWIHRETWSVRRVAGAVLTVVGIVTIAA